MISGVINRFRHRTLQRSIAFIIGGELAAVVIAALLLQYNINNWIREKAVSTMRISQAAAASEDWRSFDKVPLDQSSAQFDRYKKMLASLSKKYFASNDGAVILARLKGGEEYAMGPADTELSDSGKPDQYELAAFATRKLAFSPEPMSNDSGTYFGAYTPIVSGGHVVALVGAISDSATLADLKTIVWNAFWYSIIPVTLIFTVISFRLAGGFLEPSEVRRELDGLERPSDSSDMPPAFLELMTRRQRDVFEQMGQSLTYKQIGERLFITEETVKSHINAIRAATGFTRDQLNMYAYLHRRNGAAPDQPSLEAATEATATATVASAPADCVRRR